MKKTDQKDDPSRKLIARNRKAWHDYHILETLEAGISLVGTEVKSLRAGKCNLQDSYGRLHDGEVFLENLHISPYDPANRFNHDPRRTRKLLLRRREIKRLIGKTREKGLTLIPLTMYFKGRHVKVEIGLARGKRQYDKREAISKRESDLELRRAAFRRH